MRRIVLIILLFSSSTLRADIIEYVGSYAGWSSITWETLPSLADPDDGTAEQLDFVGDASDPGAYWGIDNGYIFFRMRLDADTVDSGTFRDSHFVLIDVEGHGTTPGIPDYGFAWDSKLNDTTKHGLEMVLLDSAGSTWNSTRMDDLDGSSASKLANDINGGGRITDGFVRSNDAQSTANFGNTTFLEFGVALSYLDTHVPELMTNGAWRIQFASLANANDHNLLTGDIAGGNAPSDTVSTDSWSEAIVIPEPASISLILLCGGGLLAANRIAGHTRA